MKCFECSNFVPKGSFLFTKILYIRDIDPNKSYCTQKEKSIDPMDESCEEMAEIESI